MSEVQILDPENFGKHSELAVKIQTALSELRPYLEADFGNITLVEITDELVVKVELHGSCADCSMINMTMKGGVESAIKSIAPEVTSIEAINI
jgi:Fe-S cluster biogenesis protein NfuA